MRMTYRIKRESLRKKEFNSGSSKVTSTTKRSTEKVELLAAVLKELVANK